jgi:hypothetical protein
MKLFSSKHGILLGSVMAVVLLDVSFNTAAAGCRSYAHGKADAIAFCKEKLNCKPPQLLACYGRTNEWKCRCEAPAKKGVMKKPGHDVRSDFSINKNMDKASPKLFKGH